MTLRAHAVVALLVPFVVIAQAMGATVTLRVQVPASTPADATVYVAGSFQGWNPGSPAHALTRQPDGRWSITLDLPTGAPIQYKFTRGSWGTVEKGPSGEEIANRTHLPLGGETVDHTVARWADGTSSSVVGDVTTFTHGPFLSGRRVWVYLPPGYHESGAHYPVLYMHDGQNLFDQQTSFSGEWQVDETCEALIASGEIEPIIVVGVDNGGAARIAEYTPWPDPSFGGGQGEAYLQALRDVLIPEIESRYRARPGAQHRYLSGSSLGGLISAYAGYAHSDTWSRVACLSSSYWYANAQMLAFAQQTGRPAGLERFYQDHGTAEPGIERLRTMRDIALAQGFVAGTDFQSIEDPGAGHNEGAWRARLPDVLRFLVDAPTCPADIDGDGDTDPNDIDAFVTAFLDQIPANADIDNDNDEDPDDIAAFVEAFVSCGQ